MDKVKPQPQPRSDPNGGGNLSGHRPYWRGAHRDWRLWACVIVMLAALMIYLTGYESAWPSRDPERQPMVAPVGN